MAKCQEKPTLQCEFEEKEYEQPLNYELAWKRRVYSPGQVFENKIAIDAAVFSKNQKFWNLWSNCEKMTWKSGTRLKRELWDLVEETWNSDRFPKFKFNLFVQHKCPEHISSPAGNEYYYWKQPYFRYDLTSHQQNTLDILEQRVSSNAIVVYACPSFWRYRDLWRFIYGKLIENSNFVQPHRLRGHERYSFIRGGKNGQAFSEPAKIEGLDILAEIDRMFKRSIEFKTNVQFVNALAREVKKVLEEVEEETRRDYFAIERAIGLPEHELGRNVMTILIFALFTNTTWGMGYQIRKEINPRVQGMINAL